jgi:hypothetical protein
MADVVGAVIVVVGSTVVVGGSIVDVAGGVVEDGVPESVLGDAIVVVSGVFVDVDGFADITDATGELDEGRMVFWVV